MDIRKVQLTTKRLLLRPIQLSDKEDIFTYASNPIVSKYTLWEPHTSLADAETYITDYIFPYYNDGVPEPFGVCFKEDPKRVLGTVGCFWVSKKNRCMELAYALGEDHWGKGITTEACQSLIKFLFESFDVQRIQAQYKAANSGSGRVMEKLGMSYEGMRRKSVFHRNQFWDMKMYSLLKDELQ